MSESFVESAMHLADPQKEVPEGLGEYQPPKKRKAKAKEDTPLTRACAHEEKPGFMIREDERNYRQHSQHNLDLIGYSMDEGGMGRSILADKTGAIIGGNGTLRMANQRGIPQRIIHTDGSELIVVVRDDLDHDDPRRQLLAVMDNSTTDSSTFDYDLMQQDFSIEQLEDMGVEIPEVELIDEDLLCKEGETEPDAVPEIAEDKKPVSVRGKVYQLGEHRLMCGDSTSAEDVAKLMNGEKADMVFTDPPYGMRLCADYSRMESRMTNGAGATYSQVIGDGDDFKPELISTIFDNFGECCEVFTWGADYYAELLPDKNKGSWIVWDKRLDDSADKMYGSCFELCWSKKKHKRDIARIKWAGLFGLASEPGAKRFHPTQKPIALAAWFLERYGEVGDVVVDLFGGSGSTLIACEQTKRRCRMMELDEHYCDVIRKRWAEFVHGEGCDWQKLTPEIKR